MTSPFTIPQKSTVGKVRSRQPPTACKIEKLDKNLRHSRDANGLQLRGRRCIFDDGTVEGQSP
jgi:hypothetical protein